MYWLPSQMIRISNSSLTHHWIYCLLIVITPHPQLSQVFLPPSFLFNGKWSSLTSHLSNRTQFVSLWQWTDQSLHSNFNIIGNILLEAVALLWAMLSLGFKTCFGVFLVALQVKDLCYHLLWLRWLLWHGFSSWPWNICLL